MPVDPSLYVSRSAINSVLDKYRDSDSYDRLRAPFLDYTKPVNPFSGGLAGSPSPTPAPTQSSGLDRRLMTDITAGLTGANAILTNAYQAAQIRDTGWQEGLINDRMQVGNYNYNNYDQLANDYSRAAAVPYFGYDDIRGMNGWQKAGSIATSGLTGLATGAAIGGLPGAVGGTLFGLAAGAGGVGFGDRSASLRQRALNTGATIASDISQRNFGAAHERIGDNTHRQRVSNVVAEGGRVQTIKDYAAKVLKSKSYGERRPSNVTRIMKDGGCVYRVKVK